MVMGIVLGISLGAYAAWRLIGPGRQPQVVERAPSPGLPAVAPDFTLKTFDGRTLSLRNLRGKPVILNFWASWLSLIHI